MAVVGQIPSVPLGVSERETGELQFFPVKSDLSPRILSSAECKNVVILAYQ